MKDQVTKLIAEMVNTLKLDKTPGIRSLELEFIQNWYYMKKYYFSMAKLFVACVESY